ncbi:hypothetical protein QJS04_geneDACA019707 [Acorus gramineus]|uniref:cyclic pyranopterin monophosphate synthase n=1 Tax=Acorus gramineus TaxID=55184 RepID=A0AAV9BWN8_ACOGR|nr:hypothetical protein QJS04_geneDACA019707 [Acorus gramineus]
MFLRRYAVARLPSLRRCVSTQSDISAAINEYNKEMEFITGESPSVGHVTPGFLNAEESPHISVESNQSEPRLTHVNTHGEANMVDISSKKDSRRVASARCRVLLGEKVYNLVAANQIAKGDVLNVAKIAGISGAKQTSQLIPLCHNIGLTHINMNLTLNEEDFSVEIEGEAATTGKTGVEMEALTAVTVAGLTVYDMCKAASKDLKITDVYLERKTGGKSGDWSRKK